MEKSESAIKIMNIEDFIHSPKHGNSLQKFLLKNDRILEDAAIGKLLLITAEEVEKIYQNSIMEIRKGMIQEEE